MKKTVAVCVLALFVSAAFADVKIETLTRVSLLAGMGDVETDSKTEFQGDKKYDISNTRMVGGILGAVAGGYTNAAEITRLDKDIAWDVYHGDATYYERPLAAMEMAQVGAGQAEVKVESKGDYEIVKSEVSVKETGEKKDINGFPCEQWVITYLVDMKDTESGETMNQEMTVDLWVTSYTDVLQTAQQEQQAYYDKLLDKLGLETSPEEMDRLGVNMMSAMYGVDDAEGKLGKVAEELGKIQGYPIVTEVKWKTKVEGAEEPEAEEPKEEKKSGFGFPTSLGDIKGMMREDISKEITGQAETGEPSAEFLFTSYQEVKSVSVKPLDAKDFEIPEGYKKRDKPKQD